MHIGKKIAICSSMAVAAGLVALAVFFFLKINEANRNDFEPVRAGVRIVSQGPANSQAASSTAALIAGCGKEGQRIDRGNGQSCCAGMKEISLPANKGADTLCMDPADQKSGSACESDNDCGPGLKCKSVEMGQTVKTCGDQDGQKEGQPCLFDSDCISGLQCKSLQSSQEQDVCVNISHQKDNAPCIFDADCAAGYVCKNINNAVQSTCVNLVTRKEGSACDFDGDCAWGYKCKSLDSTDFTKKTCTNLSAHKEGSACTFDSDCATGYVCMSVNSNDFGDKQCVNLGRQKDGASCDFDEQCATGYKCKNLKVGDLHNTCVDIGNQKDGAFCMFDGDCAPGYFCYGQLSSLQNYCKKEIPCATENSTVDGEAGQKCCGGLEPVYNFRLKSGLLAVPSAATNICTKCGDGVCGPGENGDNCAKDCAATTRAPLASTDVKYVETTVIGKVDLKVGQCQSLTCVGHEEHNNNIIKCNGTVILDYSCESQSWKNTSDTGSGDGLMQEQFCCTASGISGSGRGQ